MSRIKVIKEVVDDIGYGFGSTRNISVESRIVDGKLNQVELVLQPTEKRGTETITLKEDALKILTQLNKAISNHIEILNDEVGNVR